MPCLTYSGCLWGGGVGEESPLCSVLLSLFQEALLGIKSQFSTCLQLHNPLLALLFLPQLCAGLGTSLPSSHCLTSVSDPPRARCCQRRGTGDNHHGKGGFSMPHRQGTHTSSGYRSWKWRRGILTRSKHTSPCISISLLLLLACLQFISPCSISLKKDGSVMLPCYWTHWVSCEGARLCLQTVWVLRNPHAMTHVMLEVLLIPPSCRRSPFPFIWMRNQLDF